VWQKALLKKVWQNPTLKKVWQNPTLKKVQSAFAYALKFIFDFAALFLKVCFAALFLKVQSAKDLKKYNQGMFLYIVVTII